MLKTYTAIASAGSNEWMNEWMKPFYCVLQPWLYYNSTAKSKKNACMQKVNLHKQKGWKGFGVGYYMSALVTIISLRMNYLECILLRVCVRLFVVYILYFFLSTIIWWIKVVYSCVFLPTQVPGHCHTVTNPSRSYLADRSGCVTDRGGVWTRRRPTTEMSQWTVPADLTWLVGSSGAAQQQPARRESLVVVGQRQATTRQVVGTVRWLVKTWALTCSDRLSSGPAHSTVVLSVALPDDCLCWLQLPV